MPKYMCKCLVGLFIFVVTAAGLSPPGRVYELGQPTRNEATGDQLCGEVTAEWNQSDPPGPARRPRNLTEPWTKTTFQLRTWVLRLILQCHVTTGSPPLECSNLSMFCFLQ